jgi:hypothetical protein
MRVHLCASLLVAAEVVFPGEWLPTTLAHKLGVSYPKLCVFLSMRSVNVIIESSCSQLRLRTVAAGEVCFDSSGGKYGR